MNNLFRPQTDSYRSFVPIRALLFLIDFRKIREYSQYDYGTTLRLFELYVFVVYKPYSPGLAVVV